MGFFSDIKEGWADGQKRYAEEKAAKEAARKEEEAKRKDLEFLNSLSPEEYQAEMTRRNQIVRERQERERQAELARREAKRQADAPVIESIINKRKNWFPSRERMENEERWNKQTAEDDRITYALQKTFATTDLDGIYRCAAPNMWHGIQNTMYNVRDMKEQLNNMENTIGKMVGYDFSKPQNNELFQSETKERLDKMENILMFISQQLSEQDKIIKLLMQKWINRLILIFVALEENLYFVHEKSKDSLLSLLFSCTYLSFSTNS